MNILIEIFFPIYVLPLSIVRYLAGCISKGLSSYVPNLNLPLRNLKESVQKRRIEQDRSELARRHVGNFSYVFQTGLRKISAFKQFRFRFIDQESRLYPYWRENRQNPPGLFFLKTTVMIRGRKRLPIVKPNRVLSSRL